MARTKADQPPEPNPDERIAIIHLKGTRRYATWLEAARKETRIAKASIFRQAVEEWAEKRGIKPPPEF